MAQTLREGGLATLLFDLLTAEDEQVNRVTRHLRFDIDLLTERLVGTTDWVQAQPDIRDLHVGYFGSSTGAAAALMAAARRPNAVGAVVSRGGRPDLASPSLPDVEAPTLSYLNLPQVWIGPVISVMGTFRDFFRSIVLNLQPAGGCWQTVGWLESRLT